MTKIKTKTCQNCQQNFVIEPEDFEFYQKIDVPEPTFCPECRMIRRMCFKNEFSLYKRKCDFSGKEIFSHFSPAAPIKVYDSKIWYSDKWDPMEYGQDYDFNKPFFEQFKDLFRKVPAPNLISLYLVNSDYTMNSANLKDCYLIFGSGHLENSAYIYRSESSKDIYDSAYLNKSNLCYQCLILNNCYKAFFSSYCDDCQEIYFCRNCIDCSNCLGCANLKHKKYHIFNQPYSKEEYEKKIREFKLSSYQNIVDLQKQSQKHFLKYPVKFMHGRKNNNVTGEHIYNSKNVKDSYWVRGGEDSRYCQYLDIASTKDCYDLLSFGEECNLVYEVCGSGRNVNRVFFSVNVYIDVRDIEYSYECSDSCSNLFGCVGLRHKHYCIFNKQYAPKEYKELVAKIKQHMNEMPYTDIKGRVYKYGELFPTELSPFAYNDSLAQEHFPLDKNQALSEGYSWYDRPAAKYRPTVEAKDLPDDIKQTDESILKQIIECGNRTENRCHGSGVFRIVKQEYDFLKSNSLPLPRLCFECRHWERLKQRNQMKLYRRQCMNLSVGRTGKPCPNEFETTYAPDRPEVVYCEKCYQKEVE